MKFIIILKLVARGIWPSNIISYSTVQSGVFEALRCLIYWGQVMQIGVSKLIIIDSDNGLSPGRCQAIFWTNAGILLIQTPGTNFNENLCEIHAFSSKKIHLKILSAKRVAILPWPRCVNGHHTVAWGIADKYVWHHIWHHWTTTSNGSWCMGIKGEMSGTVCVTFTWYMYIYELFIAFVCFVVCSLL